MKYVVSLLLLLVSQSAFAGCGEQTGTCLVLAEDKETEMSCSVTVCANMHSYLSRWSFESGVSIEVDRKEGINPISIDSEPGFSIPSAILKESLTCYATEGNATIYCAKDMLL